MRLHFDRVRGALRTVFRNLMPVVLGRGVGQVSGYVDNLLASLLPTGAVAAINYAQILYFLPVSLFGLSVAAAELPSMSRATVETNAGVFEALRLRLNGGLRQIAFLVVPSSAVARTTMRAPSIWSTMPARLAMIVAPLSRATAASMPVPTNGASERISGTA